MFIKRVTKTIKLKKKVHNICKVSRLCVSEAQLMMSIFWHWTLNVSIDLFMCRLVRKRFSLTIVKYMITYATNDILYMTASIRR